MRRFTYPLLAIWLMGSACGGKPSSGASQPSEVAAAETEQPPSLQSSDILGREPVANRATVRHILIGWRDLGGEYSGQLDPRAQARSKEEAEALVKELYNRIKAGESFEALMTEHSEDESSARSKMPIDVSPDAPLVLEFKRLSLRLQVGEVGIVLTPFGWHIIQRVT